MESEDYQEKESYKHNVFEVLTKNVPKPIFL